MAKPAKARSERSYRRAARKAAHRDEQRAVAVRGGWSTVDSGAMVVVEEELGDDPLVDPVYDADDRNWVRYRPFWGGFIRLVVLGVVVVLAALWMRGRIYGWVDAQITPEGLHGDAIKLTIPQGASVNEIAGELQSEGVISNATVFRYWLRCDGELTITRFLGCDSVVAVEAGDYYVYENMDFASVRTVFEAGPLPEVFELVRIPEGLRWSEMAPPPGGGESRLRARRPGGGLRLARAPGVVSPRRRWGPQSRGHAVPGHLRPQRRRPHRRARLPAEDVR